MARILIVDDDPSITNLLATLLEEEGYETVTANSGQRALEVVRRDPPDAVLLDLMMPVVSGSVVCQQLKGNEKTRPIPVIIVSGDGHADRKTELAGADAFITKPFELDTILDCVRKFCHS